MPLPENTRSDDLHIYTITHFDDQTHEPTDSEIAATRRHFPPVWPFSDAEIRRTWRWQKLHTQPAYWVLQELQTMGKLASPTDADIEEALHRRLDTSFTCAAHSPDSMGQDLEKDLTITAEDVRKIWYLAWVDNFFPFNEAPKAAK